MDLPNASPRTTTLGMVADESRVSSFQFDLTLIFSKIQGSPQGFILAWVVFLAVTESCLFSGALGAVANFFYQYACAREGC